MEESKKAEDEAADSRFVVDNRWLTFTAASNLCRLSTPSSPMWTAPSLGNAADRFLARLASFGGVRLSGSFFTHLDPRHAPGTRSALCLMRVCQLIPSHQRVVHDTFFEGVAVLVDTDALSRSTAAGIPAAEAGTVESPPPPADVPDCVSVVSVEERPPLSPPLPAGPAPSTDLQRAVSHVYFKRSSNLAITAGPMRMGMGVLAPPVVDGYLLGTMESGPSSTASASTRPHRKYRLTLQNWVGVAEGTAKALAVVPSLQCLDLYSQRFLFFDEAELGDTMWVLMLFIQAYDSGLPDRMALFDTFTKREEHVEATPDCPAKGRGSTLARPGMVDDAVAELERMFNNSAYQFVHTLKAARGMSE